MAHFAGYGFNKSHSAAYAHIAYQTAYLKAHYPLEFMAATMSSEMDNTDRIVVLIEECRRMGIEVLPPDVNESFANRFCTGSKSFKHCIRMCRLRLSSPKTVVMAEEVG